MARAGKTPSTRRIDWLKLIAWLAVVAFSIGVWLLAAHAFAAEYDHGLLMPPAQYVKPCKVSPIVEYLNEPNAESICRAGAPGTVGMIVGCTMPIVGGGSYVVIATKSSVPVAAILEHELAHACGDWPADHPR